MDPVNGKKTRRELRTQARAKLRSDRKLKKKVSKILLANGVLRRVETVAAALAEEEVTKAIAAAVRRHELENGPISDYHVLRQVVSTVLSLRGFDMQGVNLKFAWDGKSALAIAALPAVDTVIAAADQLKVERESAFRAMLH